MKGKYFLSPTYSHNRRKMEQGKCGYKSKDDEGSSQISEELLIIKRQEFLNEIFEMCVLESKVFIKFNIHNDPL